MKSSFFPWFLFPFLSLKDVFILILCHIEINIGGRKHHDVRCYIWVYFPENLIWALGSLSIVAWGVKFTVLVLNILICIPMRTSHCSLLSISIFLILNIFPLVELRHLLAMRFEVFSTWQLGRCLVIDGQPKLHLQIPKLRFIRERS